MRPPRRTLRHVVAGWILASVALSSAAASDFVLRRVNPSRSASCCAAVVTERAALIHTTQLLSRDSSASAEAQWSDVLEQLDLTLKNHGASRRELVKLNLYAADAAALELIRERLPKWCGVDAMPAVSAVTTRLPGQALVGLDAIVAQDEDATRPGATLRRIGKLAGSTEGAAQTCTLQAADMVFVSGQAEPGDLPKATAETLKSLQETLRHMGLERRDIVQIKCFLAPMSRVQEVDDELRKFFVSDVIPPVSHVEWIAGARPIEIELVAAAPLTLNAPESVSFLTPPKMKPSPVFSRVARLHGATRIYCSGLHCRTEADAEAEVRDIFHQLRETLNDARSDWRHLAKATYYVSGDDASESLNRLRPEFYDSDRPPAASKAMVRGVGRARRSITLDMIAGPQ